MQLMVPLPCTDFCEISAALEQERSPASGHSISSSLYDSTCCWALVSRLVSVGVVDWPAVQRWQHLNQDADRQHRSWAQDQAAGAEADEPADQTEEQQKAQPQLVGAEVGGDACGEGIDQPRGDQRRHAQADRGGDMPLRPQQ